MLVSPSDSSFAMTAQRNREKMLQPHSALPDFEQARLAPEPIYKLYDNPREDFERRLITARASSEMRILSAICRTMDRSPPASGNSGFKGSIDDPACPPTLYEWMQAVVNDEAYRWEATTTVKPRCIFCNARHTNLRAHVEQLHASKWRQAMLTTNDMTPQDVIGMYFYVAVLAEISYVKLNKEEEVALCNLLEVHNHLSFIQPGGPFLILNDRYTSLSSRALAWAADIPPDVMWQWKGEQPASKRRRF